MFNDVMKKGPENKKTYVNEFCLSKREFLVAQNLFKMRLPGLLKFGIKAGIMSSALYLTIDKGVWKDSETTGELYEELQKQIKPYVKPLVEQIPFEIPKLPETGDVASTAKTTWNKAVMATCLFLVELPELACNYVKEGSTFAYEKLKELQMANENQTEQNK